MKGSRVLLAAAVIGALSASAGAADAQNIAVGNRNTFQDGTPQGWMINLLGMGGGVPQPQVVPTGGPGGAGDAFLQLSASGQAGPGGRLTALNLTPTWTGNYRAAGVNAIQLDAINLGSTDLALRLVFENPGPASPPTDLAATLNAQLLLANSGWQTLIFPLFGVGGLQLFDPSMDLEALLANTTMVRLFHSDTFGWPPTTVAAQVGIDNIVATPEPATLLLVGGGVAAVAAVARRRRRTR